LFKEQGENEEKECGGADLGLKRKQSGRDSRQLPLKQ